MFCKKGVLRNIAKFTGKHLCQSLFFNKIAGLRPATLLKKRLWHRCFPVNFAKFRRTPIFTEQLRWLLLLLSYSNLLEETSIIIKNVYFIQLYRYFNFAGSFNLSLKLHDHLFDFFYG